ncbi:MAG: beta-galactosidase [Planctomycetes bacterium]|nr:beta-galactosidase [Planctomycetota bacterium]
MSTQGKFSVRQQGGQLFIDGKPVPPLMFLGNGEVFFDTVEKMAGEGIHLFSCQVEMIWGATCQDETLQRDKIRRFVEKLLNADPKALLLPRFGTEPAWWAEANPQERSIWGDGSYGGHGSVSMASEKWRKEMLLKLDAFVKWFEQEWDNHILGYFPHACCESYFMYFFNRQGELPCFEPVFLDGFRNWLKKRYRTIDKLNGTWKSRLGSWGDVILPTVEERWASTGGLFRDPQREQSHIDFTRYGNEVVYEVLSAICHTIKGACEHRKITMIFYGYLMEMAGNWQGYGCGPVGHCALAYVLADPDIDFIAAPASYSDRAPGESIPWMGPVDSVLAARTGWGDEIDVRTHLSPEDSGYGRCSTAEETGWVHSQAFAQAIVHRSFMWFMDMGGGGWLNDEGIVKRLGRFREFSETNRDAISPFFRSEFAVVVDEESHLYMAYDAGWLLGRPLLCDLRKEINRIGTTPAWLRLTDILDMERPLPKLILMLNAFKLDNSLRMLLLERLRDSGATVVWFFAPGYVTDIELSMSVMSELTGFEFELNCEPSPIRVFTGNCDSSLLAGVDRDSFPEDEDTRIMVGAPTSRIPIQEKHVGTRRVTPRFNIKMEQAGNEVVARYEDGHIAIARRSGAGFNSIYVGTFWVPAKLLANIATESGCHLYAETGTTVTTDGRLLAVSSKTGGSKNISLPGRATIEDVFDSTALFENQTQFQLNLKPGETRLLRICHLE